MLLFNRYEYNPQTDLLGKGGFSRVYKALDKKLQRLVALKIYKTGEVSERYSLGSEIQRVINLDHPNISRYLDIDDLENENAFGEVERIQVCVMELLDGGSILSYYRAHPENAVLIKLLTDVLSGLAYLHENDIIHRDIKPGNILIKNTKSGPVAKITDFGISKISGAPSNSDSSSALIVSIPYMAPEQLNAKKFGIDGRVSFNIDLWSLGVAVYEIVSGDTLFKNNQEDSPEQIMLNIMAPGIPGKINQLPEPFCSFVAKCVIKDARERTDDIDHLIELLKRKPAQPARLEQPAEIPEPVIEVNGKLPVVTLSIIDIPASNIFPETHIITEPANQPVIFSIPENDLHNIPAASREIVASAEEANDNTGDALVPALNKTGSGEVGKDPSDLQQIHNKDFTVIVEDIEKNEWENDIDSTQILDVKTINRNEVEDDLSALTYASNEDSTNIATELEKPGSKDNTDDTQILDVKRINRNEVEEDLSAQPYDSNGNSTNIGDQIKKPGPKDNADDTQILDIKSINRNEVEKDLSALQYASNEDFTNIGKHIEKYAAKDDADDTQVLSVKVTGRGEAEDEPSDAKQMENKTESNADGDDTQILQPAQIVKQENQDDTALLSITPQLTADDAEATMILGPGTTGNERSAEGKQSGVEKGVANHDVKAVPAVAEETENKILLFKRYEYYPHKNLIGKGGFSRVYKAFDKKLQRWVALKIYKTGNFSDRYSPIAEIQRVINLDHSNICRYLDIEEIEKINPFGEEETIQVCVMELLDSGNLLEYFEKNPDPEIFKKLLRDVFMGLSYLHKNGIVHRDIKPANILIKQTMDGPIAKITDFGISKKSDAINNNSSSALVVSIPYMAPEQLNVKKYGINGRISFNLDLWSLGVTIYEVLSGKVLFKNSEADNSEQIMTNIMAAELPDKIKDLESPFAEIVARCIVKKATDRAQRVEELLEILQHDANPVTLQPVFSAGPPMPVVKEADNTQKPPKQPDAQQSAVEKTAGNGSRSGFYVLEDDVKSTDQKPASRKRYLLPALILAFLVVAIAVTFYIKRDGSETVNALPDKENHTAVADTITAVQHPVINDSVPKESRKNDPVQKPVPVAPVNNHKENNTVVEKKKKKEESVPDKIIPKREKIAGDTYLLELNATVNCIVKINSFNYGEIKAGGKMKVWLSSGNYQIKVTSTADNKEIYSKNIDVSAGQLGSVGHLQIK